MSKQCESHAETTFFEVVTKITLIFQGTIEMIAMWEAKQYQKMVDNAKHLKDWMNDGFHTFFLCSNDSLHVTHGGGVTAAFHTRIMSTF